MASKLPPAALSLKQFMQRQEVLKLYRDILRAVRSIPDQNSRQELLTWARDDFRANKHQTDENTVKALMFYAQRSLNELRQSLALSKG